MAETKVEDFRTFLDKKPDVKILVPEAVFGGFEFFGYLGPENTCLRFLETFRNNAPKRTFFTLDLLLR